MATKKSHKTKKTSSIKAKKHTSAKKAHHSAPKTVNPYSARNIVFFVLLLVLAISVIVISKQLLARDNSSYAAPKKGSMPKDSNKSSGSSQDLQRKLQEQQRRIQEQRNEQQRQNDAQNAVINNLR